MKFGLTEQQFDKLDYRTASLYIKAQMKIEEERINNNIMTGAKSALKVIQYYSGSRHASDMNFVDFKVCLDTDSDSTKEMATYKSEFDLLKSHNIDPIEFIRKKEQEALQHGL